MSLNKDIVSFSNFKGLFSRHEAGLIPDGYASELQNVQCRDGTITFLRGYSKEDNGTTSTTYPGISDVNDSFIRNLFSYKRMDGTQVKLAWLDDGKLLWYSSSDNKYQLLKDLSGQFGTEKDLGVGVYYLANDDEYKRSQAYIGSNIQSVATWTGGMASFASATSNTLTKEGTTTWSQEYFADTGSVIIGGTTYAYTGGQNTTTLTGVSPDPTVAGHATSIGIAQVLDDGPSPSFDSTPFASQFVTYKGRLFISSSETTQLQGSAVGNPSDFSGSGVGDHITANIGDGNGPITAIANYKNRLVIFKRDAIIMYETDQTTSTNENTKIQSIVIRQNIGPINQGSVAVGRDEIYFVSADKEIRQLSKVLALTERTLPEVSSISAEINPTLDGLIFDNASSVFEKDKLLIACREGDDNDTVIEFDTINKTFYIYRKPVKSFMVVDNNIFFSNPYTVQVYKWEDGYDDDGGAIGFLWRSGRHRFGDQFRRKKFNTFMCYARMSTTEILSVQLDYNHLGSLHRAEFDVKGDGTSSDNGLYIISDPVLTSYGANQYGIVPYGSKTTPESDTDIVDVIFFKKIPVRYSPYDLTVQFSSSDVAQRCKIIEYGLMPEFRREIPKRAIIS